MSKFGEIDDGKWKNLAFRLKFLSYWFVSSYCLICCHTERSEVSTNLKCEFIYLKRGFFILNSKRALNSMDFSLSAKAQNDKNKPKARFACHTDLSCLTDLFSLVILSLWRSIQKTLYIVILSAAKYPQNQSMDFSPFCKGSKWQKCAVIASRFHKNGVAIQKLGLNFALNSKRKLKKMKCFEFEVKFYKKVQSNPCTPRPL